MTTHPNITPRELDVLQLLNHHLADKEIAAHLKIRLDTVKDHVKSIREKLSAVNRAHAVDIARQMGLIQPLEDLKPKRNLLPKQSMPLIGRSHETHEIISYITKPDVRLATITGPGGIGKTRIALHVAHELFDSGQYPDGIFFVSLLSLDSEYQLIRHLVEVLGLGEIINQQFKTAVMNFLADKAILLIFDNYEHFLPQLDFVKELIEASQADILVTSRERLNLRGEALFLISGLPYENNGIDRDAFELFVACLSRLQALKQFDKTEEDLIHHICQLVQGFPLAIELAVSWAYILPLQTIAREIEKSLDILENDKLNLPARHQSIRAVFNYSMQFLAPELKQIFLSLAYCKGTFSLEAAIIIAGANPANLRDLVDKSLMYVSEQRYVFHALIRQYAQEVLQSYPSLAEQSRDRYLMYYFNFLGENAEKLHSAEEYQGLILLRQEYDNIRHAIHMALQDNQFQFIRQCLYGLLMFYELNSMYEEGGEVFKSILNKGKDVFDASFLAMLELAICAMNLHTDNFDDTKKRLLQCIQILNPMNPYWLGIGYRLLGELETNQGNLTAAKEYLTESIEIYEEIRAVDSEIHLALAERQLGLILQDAGKAQEALPHYRRSQELFRQRGYDRGLAMVLHRLGEVAHHQGDYVEAKSYYIDSLAIHEKLKDMDGIGRVYNKLGSLAYQNGDFDQALEYFRVSYDIAESIGASYQLAVYANNLGVLAQDRQDYEQAQKWFEQCLKLAEKIGDNKHRGLAFNNLGKLAYAQKQYEKALDFCLQGLAIRRKTMYMQGLLHSLLEVGKAYAALGQSDKAMQRYIEGLALAIQSQSVVRGLDFLFAVSRIITEKKPCLAQNIRRLVASHEATQATTRRLAEEAQQNAVELICDSELETWEGLAGELLKEFQMAVEA